MNLNLTKRTDIHKKSNFMLYTIEKGDTPFLYYHMVKNANQIITMPTIYLKTIGDATSFMDKHFTDYEYKGTLIWNDENYIFYEIVDTIGITPTYYLDSWWKVTPYEIMYTQKVLTFPIDKYYFSFFKENPQSLFIIEKGLKYETPIVGYIGLDEIELNEQFLLSKTNYKKGYYFSTIEKAYFDSLYADVTPNGHLVKLINYNVRDTKSTEIEVKHDKFYLNNAYIGDVPPNCNKTTYKLDNYNENFIYLRSDKKLKCATEYFVKRKDPGCMIRYVIFLKKSSITPKMKRGYDSFTYGNNAPYWFPTYMVRKSDQFVPLSYHYSVDNSLQAEYIHKRDKDTLIRIK
jgi:hypothetical protein